MPELPEVETARRLIADLALGRRIVGVDDADTYVCRPHSPGELRAALTGRTLTAARRRGKQIWCETSGVAGSAGPGPDLGIHLGMAGRIMVTAKDGWVAEGGDRAGRDAQPRKAEWDRFTLEFADGGQLALFDKRRLGRILLDPGPDRLGPDAVEVTPAEFQKIAAEGRARLHAIQDAPWSVHGLFRHWDAIKARTYAEVRKPWGGATVDPRTGDDLPQGADKFAMSVKPTGLGTTSIGEHASAAEFDRAMDSALGKYRKQLAKGGSYLGIFHDDDLGRIDIDPVTVLDTQDDVEKIGSYTGAIGGAYNFKDGNGYWPPHVATGAQMAGEDEQHHWAGPGQWRSHAVAVQEPHDEPEDAEPAAE